MNESLLERLECPLCSSRELELSVVERAGDDVVTGVILCGGCPRWYPVRRSIVSFLPDPLRPAGEGRWLATIAERLPETVRARVVAPSGEQEAGAADDVVETKRHEIELRDDEAELYDEIYPDEKFQAELEAYDELFDPPPQATVLDLGCGTGRVTRHLLARTSRLVGIDLSFRSLVRLRDKLPEAAREQVQLVQGDVCYLPFRQGAFDWVVSHGLICTLPGAEMRDRTLAGVSRVLVDGGPLILSTYNFSLLKRVRGWLGLAQTGRKEGYKEGSVYYYNHAPGELVAWLSRDFDVEQLRGTDNRLPVLQHLSHGISARLDRFLSRTPLSLPIVAREMVAKARKRGA